MTSRAASRIARHKCDIIREQLNQLHDTYGLSWRKISNMGEYKGIPPGTLCSIAKGERDIPDKYKVRFGIPFDVPASVCLIHNTVHQYDCRTQSIKSRERKQRSWKRLLDIPKAELLWMLRNRSADD